MHDTSQAESGKEDVAWVMRSSGTPVTCLPPCSRELDRAVNLHTALARHEDHGTLDARALCRAGACALAERSCRVLSPETFVNTPPSACGRSGRDAL